MSNSILVSLALFKFRDDILVGERLWQLGGKVVNWLSE